MQALDQEANHFLSKPFGVQELFAASGRPSPGQSPGKRRGRRPFHVRSWWSTWRAVRCTAPAKNSPHPQRYRILAVLVRHAGKVVTHERLLREVWGPNSAEQVHYVRIYLSSLRRKLEGTPPVRSTCSQSWAWAIACWTSERHRRRRTWVSGSDSRG